MNCKSFLTKRPAYIWAFADCAMRTLKTPDISTQRRGHPREQTPVSLKANGKRRSTEDGTGIWNSMSLLGRSSVLA